jgi:hypothetical protein
MAEASTIQVVTVKRYLTTDGRYHETIEDARSAQFRINLAAMMDRDGVGRGGEWDSSMIHDWIVENHHELCNISSGRLVKKRA